MKLSPLDLHQQRFQKSVRGYDPKQVDAFLELVRAEWEALLRENQQQKDELARKEALLQEFQEKERILRETLITAQRMSNDIKQTAKKEAEIVVGQAELQADKIIHQAHSRLTQLIDEINELKRQRAEFEGRLTGIIEAHRRLLDLGKDARESSQIEDVTILPSASSS
ncbi:MAG: DivIVA domain-containing protein [Pseudomonadota bacterium]